MAGDIGEDASLRAEAEEGEVRAAEKGSEEMQKQLLEMMKLMKDLERKNTMLEAKLKGKEQQKAAARSSTGGVSFSITRPTRSPGRARSLFSRRKSRQQARGEMRR